MTHSHWSRSAREKWQELRTRGRRRERHKTRSLRERAVRLGMEQLEDRRLLAVTISDNKYTSGSDFILSDSESITIADNVVIDTSNHGGAAGGIKLSAPIINIGNRVQLIASGTAPGAITLTANHTWADPTLAFWDFLQSIYTGPSGLTASICIGDSGLITGGDFSAIVTAGDNEVLAKSETTPFVGQFESQVFNYLNDLIDLPISVVYKTPSASMTLGSGTQIVSSGKVSLTATSIANAQGEAIFNMITDKVTKGLGGYGGFAIGVSYTDVQATTTVSQNSAITAGSDVIISASAVNTTAIKARVTQNVGMQPTNPGNWQLAFGWSELNSTATTLVDTGSVVTAGGNVQVTATGKDVDQVSVSTASYRDGKVGVTVGVGRTTANIQATVNGTIHSGNAPVAASETFNPALTVDFADSSLCFATAPGYHTGDAVLYSSGLGGPIPGLLNGETYYAIADPAAPNAIKLAASLADAVAHRNIAFRPAYPTLSAGGLTVPVTRVQVQGSGAEDSNLILFDFATQSDGVTPLFTEGQTVTFTPSAGNYLGQNNSSSQLVGPLPAGAYRVHIVHDTADVQGLYAIQLRDASGVVIQLNDNPVFKTAAGDSLEVYAFDPDAGTVNFNFPDSSLSSRNVTLTNGQPLTYTQALATNVTGLNDGQTYYAVVDPAAPGVIRLASTASQAQAANPAIQRAQPTLTVSSQTFNIDSVEPDVGLIFSVNPNVPDGTAVVYHAVPGKPIGGLTDGNTYYAYNQSIPYFDPDSPVYALTLREHHLYGQDVTLSLVQTLTDGGGNVYPLRRTDSLRNVLSIASPNPLSVTASHDAQLVGGKSTLQSLPANSQQIWTNGTGGTFTISAVINSQTLTTTPLAFNATAAQIQAALNQLAGLSTTVTGLGTYTDPWLVSAAEMPSLTIDDSQLQQGVSWMRVVPNGAQRLSNSANGGTFTLSVSVDGKTLTTASLPYNATADQVETALDALAGVQATVTGAGTAADPWLIHGGIFLIQSGDPLTFSDSFGAGNAGLLNGQTYYAAVAPSQPYPDLLLLALAATRDEALQASPTAVECRQSIDLGRVDLSYMSGTTHIIAPAAASGGIIVQASLASKDAMSTGASTGGEPGLLNLLNQGDIASNFANGTTGWERVARDLLGKADKEQKKSLGDLIEEKAAGQQANNSFSLAASIGYLDVNNTVATTIGGTATLLTDGDIAVKSVLTESVQPQVTSGVSKPKVEGGGSTGTSFATAVMIGHFNNTSHSIVESQARLTASHQVKVGSDIVYPWAWQIANPGGFNAETFFADNTLANLSTLLDGNLGIDNWLVNSWSQALAPSPQSKLTFTLSVSCLDFTNDSLAQVCDGAQINQDAGVAFAADQGVSITADTDMVQIGFAGTVGLGFSPDQISKVIRKGGASGFLNTMQGGTIAIGGAFGCVSVDNTTQAFLGGSPPDTNSVNSGDPGITRLSFGNGGLDVNADEHITYIELALGGSDGQQYGISGTLTLPEIDNTTKARVFAGAVIQSLDDTQGKLDVSAVDDLDLITTSGGVVIGSNVQVGVSTGVGTITRTVLALIGDDPDSAASGASTFNVNGPIKVEADAKGVIVSAAVAASVLSASPPPGAEQPIQNEGDQQAGDAPKAGYGWAVSGDFTQVGLTDYVTACVNDLGVFTGINNNFSVKGSDSTKIISAGGAAAFSTSNNAKSVGLAGSGSVIDVTGSIEASVSGASLNHFALSVNASDDRTFINLAAGGSGARVGNSNIAIAGSAAVTTLHDTTTQASLDGVNAVLSGDSKVEADDNSALITVAGEFVMGGKSGYGLGSTVNNVNRTTQALVTNSRITQNTGGMSLAATDSLTSVSIAAGMAYTNTVVALAGMFADNVSSSTTAASLNGGSYSNQDATSAGCLSVSAQDTPVLVTLAGDAGANDNGNWGFGAAVTYASVSSTNSATLSGTAATLAAGGLSLKSTSGDPPGGLADSDLDQLDLPGRSNHALYSFSIGGAGSKNVSLAGSVTVNNIHGSNLANIAQNALVTAGGPILVQATNGTTIGSASGAVTASPDGRVAFGAAVVDNSINTNTTDTTLAQIDSSQVGSTSGSIDVQALSNLQIDSAAAGGNGAMTFAGGGSVVDNAIGNSTSATISNSNSIVAASDVTVQAGNTSKIGTGAGQVDIATKGSTVGAAVAVNSLDNAVGATIAAATVTAAGAVQVTANSHETIDAYALGVGGSTGASNYSFPAQVGLVGSGAGNTIDSSTIASIEQKSSVTSGGAAAVTASDTSSITALAGVLSLTPVARGTVTAAVGASVAMNNLSDSDQANQVKAVIDASTVSAGSFQLSAEAIPSIVAITAAGAGDFSKNGQTLVGIGGAGAGSNNDIEYVVQALIGNGSQVTTNGNGNLSMLAHTDGDIKSVAGGVAAAGEKVGVAGSAVEVTVGAAVAVNSIDCTTQALIQSSTAKAGGNLTMTAKNESSIEAYTIGVASSVVIGGKLGVDVGLVGSGSGNTISSTTQASIQKNSSAAADLSKAVALNATDSSSITAVAGSLTIDVGSDGAAVGASAAVNSLGSDDTPNCVQATIDNSTVKAGQITVNASANPSILAITIAGGGDYSNGKTLAVGIAGAGAGSSNDVNYTIQALVTGNSRASTIGGTDINISASNSIDSNADAGGIALAGDVGGRTGVAVTVGAAVAVNTGTITTSALVLGSTIETDGDLAIAANSQTDLESYTVGVAGSLSISGTNGIAVGGAGSGSGNTITSTTEAKIDDLVMGAATIRSYVTSGKGVSLTATDSSQIVAGAGAAAIAIGSGKKSLGVAVAIGASVSINSITSTVTANINNSSVQASDDVQLTATTQRPDSTSCNIEAVTVAGGVAVGVGGQDGAVAFAGAGAGSGNTIKNTVTASITNCTGNDSQNKVISVASQTGNVTLTAQDGMAIRADGGGVTVSFGGGTGTVAVGVAVGMGFASNTLTNTTTACIDHSNVTAGGEVTLNSFSTASPDAKGFGVALDVSVSQSGGISGAGSGAGAYNKLTNTIQARIQNGSIVRAGSTAKDAVSLSATDSSESTSSSGAGSLSVGVYPQGVGLAAGAVVANNTIKNSVFSVIDNSSVTSSGGVSLATTNSPEATAVAVAVAATITASEFGGAFTGSGANSTNSVTNTVTAAIQNKSQVQSNGSSDGAGVSLSASDAVTIDASVGTGALAIGFIGASIGVSLTDNSVEDTVTAEISDSAVSSFGQDIRVAASSDNTVTGMAVATAATVSLFGVSGAGGHANSSDNSIITASVDADATIETDGGSNNKSSTFGGLIVSASSGGTVNAEVDGGVLAMGSIGVFFANATRGGNTIAFVDGEAALTIGNLSVSAESAYQIGAKGWTLTIGFLTGDGTTATALAKDSVQAYVGSSLTDSLPSSWPTANPNGSLSVNAEAKHTATATADGGVGSLGFPFSLGVGVYTASSTVQPTVQAYLRGINVSIPGTLAVTSGADNSTAASATAGSGGLVAGDAALANTGDTTHVTAALYGGTFHAGSVLVASSNSSSYAPHADSVNAAVVGGSGAVAGHQADTSTTTSLSDSTSIYTPGTVSLTATEKFAELTQGNSATAAAGGVVNGTAAVSEATLTGNAVLSVGNSVTITSGNDPAASPGGILMFASTDLTVDDRVTLTTGGAIEGAGVNSKIIATLNNKVAVGSNGNFTSQGNIGAGTQATVNAEANSAVTTYGIAGVGVADASTTVTSNQQVTVGTQTAMTAFGNLNLTAGAEPVGLGATILSGSAYAQAYVRGIIAIPDARANSTVTSNTSLNVGAGAQLASGQNITVGTYPGTPGAFADGTGHGYELGLIPAKQSSESSSAATTSNSVLNGTMTAGIYHELSITIPNDQSGANGFSQTVYANPDGSAYVPFPSYFTPSFIAPSYIDSHFTGDTATVLKSGVSDQYVAACNLGPLFATGGTVTVNADSLSGSGTITAYGGPKISVTNNSPNYLILGPINIPNLPGGQVNFTIAPAPAGMTVNQINKNQTPSVTVTQTYGGNVGGASYGPALFLMGDIENLGGDVTITNTAGSLGQAATIFAKKVTVTVPEGAVAIDIPNGTYYVGGNPYSDWNNSMIWPGGNPAAGTPNADLAVSYVANATFSPPVTNPSDPFALAEYQISLYGIAGANAPGNQSTVFFGNSLPYVQGMGDDTRATNSNWGFRSGAGGAAYLLGSGGPSNNQGWLPFVPVTNLRASATAYPAISESTAIYGGAVTIHAKTLDLNGNIKAGHLKNWSVNFPEALGETLADYREGYLDGRNPPICAIPLDEVTTVTAGDNLITASYNAQTNQIILDNVSVSTAAEVILNGAIINTHPQGKIEILGGQGQVTVNNLTDIPLVVQDIVADEKASISRIDITDTNLPDDSNRTLYLSEPGQPIAVFKGQAGDSSLGTGTPDSTVSGTTTAYNPQSGLRWQWIQQASLNRTITDWNSWQITDWMWNFPAGSPNNPWQYLDPATNQWTGTPAGQTVIKVESNVFEQIVTGTIDSQTTEGVIYHSGHYGFANNGGQSEWDYHFPLSVTLTMTSSVKADNPIVLDFSGIATDNALDIASIDDILLTGTIQAAASQTSAIQSISGSLAASSGASLTSGSLTLQAGGSIGATGVPLSLTLNNNGVLNASAGIGGIYLVVDSIATLGQLQSGTGNARGNVVLEAADSIVAASGTSAPSNVFGNNITLTSDHGGIGSEDTPVLVSCQGRLRVNSTADVWVEQSQGDLGVDQILSTGGDVNVSVPQGSLFDATAWMINSVPTEVQQQVYQSLGLTDPSASQATVTSFENLAERNYQLYWQLMQYGSFENGAYTLSPGGMTYYKTSLAGQGLEDLSNTQVQASASNLYGSVSGFFGANLSANWQSLPEFQTYTPGYQYTAGDSQVNSLTQNAVWNLNQLTYMVHHSGMQSSLVGSADSNELPANITGKQVNLSAGKSIGEQDAPLFLPLAGLQAGTYTPSQAEALALSRGNQPGDVMLVGNHAGYGGVYILQDFDTNTDSITAIQVSLSRPLRIATAYPLNASAQSAVNVQQTGSSLQISGFGGSGTGWTTNSSTAGLPAINSDILTLTDSRTDEATSAWLQLPVSTSDFQASFTYHGYGMADGMAFVLHNDPRGLNALGANGGSLGYGGSTGTAITPSAAFEINLYAGGGSLIPGTNFVTNGAQGNYNPTGSITLSIGSPIQVVLTYDSTAQTLTESLTDIRSGASFTRVHSGINLAATLGATALLGFTGGTGGMTSTQTISNFQFIQNDIRHLVVGQIHSADGDVNLQADGSIVAAPASSAGAAGLISAAGLTIDSGGSAGVASAPLRVSLAGQANVAAATGVNVQQINGNLHVGYAECNVADNVTFTAPNTVFVDHPGISGFGGNGYDWALNNSPNSSAAGISQDVLTLTNGTAFAASSAWFDAAMPTDSFQVGFRYTGSGGADGAAFVLHNDPRGLTAIGDAGSGLGYGSSSGGAITPSVAWQINLYYPHDGVSSHVSGTNLAFNGSTGSYHSTTPVVMNSGNAIDVVLVYDAAAHTLTELLTDTQTSATFFNTYTGIDLTALLGPTAYIGFTGADGEVTSTQTIQNFQFSAGQTSALAANGGVGLPANPWHNPLNAEDVNGDSLIAPRDALAVINHLNRHLNVMVLPIDSADPFMDVNADGHVTPMDVLVVINRLNRRSRAVAAEGGGTAGEGESTANQQLSRALSPQITFWHGSGQLSMQRFAAVGANGQSISAEADGHSSSPDWIRDRLFGAAHRATDDSRFSDTFERTGQFDNQLSDLEDALSAIAEDVNERWL